MESGQQIILTLEDAATRFNFPVERLRQRVVMGRIPDAFTVQVDGLNEWRIPLASMLRLGYREVGLGRAGSITRTAAQSRSANGNGSLPDTEDSRSDGVDADQLAVLRAERQSLDRQRTALALESQSLDARRAALEAAKAELEASQAELDARRAALEAAKAELEASQVDLAALRAKTEVERGRLSEEQQAARRETEKLRHERQLLEEFLEKSGRRERKLWTEQLQTRAQDLAEEWTALDEAKRKLAEADARAVRARRARRARDT